MKKVVKPYIKTARDNEEYIILGSKINICFLQDKECLEYQKEMDILWNKINEYERKEKVKALDIVVKKDSIIGKHLLSSSKVENLDNYIYCEDALEALTIATLENNPIFQQIIPIVKKQVSGTKENLSSIYGNEVIEYISKHHEFDIYLKQINDQYKPKQYLVYDNYQLIKKEIIDNSKTRIIVK